jgi:hypothetical protein
MSSAEARRDAIIAAWKAHSSELHLSGEQETKIKAWFSHVFAAVEARRAEIRGKIADLAKATTDAEKGAALDSIRESFKAGAAGREKALAEFDSILSVAQRAQIVLYIAKVAESKKKQVDNFFEILAGGGADD